MVSGGCLLDEECPKYQTALTVEKNRDNMVIFWKGGERDSCLVFFVFVCLDGLDGGWTLRLDLEVATILNGWTCLGVLVLDPLTCNGMLRDLNSFEISSLLV